MRLRVEICPIMIMRRSFKSCYDYNDYAFLQLQLPVSVSETLSLSVSQCHGWAATSDRLTLALACRRPTEPGGKFGKLPAGNAAAGGPARPVHVRPGESGGDGRGDRGGPRYRYRYRWH